MAIITRWRMPPENSCGYMSSRRAASGMPHQLQHGDAALRAPRLARCPVLAQHLGHLARRSSGTGSARSSGPGRSSPSRRRGSAFSCARRQVEDFLAAIAHRPVLRAVLGQQAHDRQEDLASCPSRSRPRRPGFRPRRSTKPTSSAASTSPSGVAKRVAESCDLEHGHHKLFIKQAGDCPPAPRARASQATGGRAVRGVYRHSATIAAGPSGRARRAGRRR